VVSPTPNPQEGGTSFVGYPQLLIQSTYSYPPYLEAGSTIHTLDTAKKRKKKKILQFELVD
jgi:hypothetical protein